MSYIELLVKVLGYRVASDADHIIDVGCVQIVVARVRAALGEDGIRQRYIRTVRGVGYQVVGEGDVN